MIIIYTDQDVRPEHDQVPVEIVQWGDLDADKIPSGAWAEDVYFWRDGEVKVLKRRNAPLIVPEWLKDLEGVDR